METVKHPNLPQNARAVIIGEKYSKLLGNSLEKLQIQPIFVPNNPNVDPRLSGHADLSVLHLGEGSLLLAPYLAGSDFSEKLASYGLQPEYPDISQSPEYPNDVQLNICICGKSIIYNPTSVPATVANYFTNKKFSLIPVKQGYTKCSVCVLNDSAVITADRGIAASAAAAGIDVLQIRAGFISLSGYDYGFIGGANFKISSGKLAFTGNLNAHPDKALILNFLEKHNIEPVYLTNEPIFDIGSGIPITE